MSYSIHLACDLQIDAYPDPDPTFQFDADPEPQHCQKVPNFKKRRLRCIHFFFYRTWNMDAFLPAHPNPK